MSDTAINKIIQKGTAAARIAFTPNPAVGSNVLYIWFETDNSPDVYVWNGAAWVQINAAVSGGINQLTGDVTAGPGSGSEVATIPNDTITYAKMQNVSAASRVLGRGSAAGAGDVEELTVGTGLALTGTVLSATGGGGGITELTGDVVAGPGSGVQAAVIPNDTVIYAKIQNVAASRLLGRQSGSSGDIEEVPVSTGLELDPTFGLRATDAVRTTQIGITVDGGGSVLTTGLKGFKSFPVAGQIVGWRLLADQVGAIVFDIWKDTFANFPPTSGDFITASTPPTITASAQSAENTTLTGWNTGVAAGDVFGFNIISVAAITRITLELTIRKS